MYKFLLALVGLFATTLVCQIQPSVPTGPPAEKPRVFVTDSQSWEMEGSAGGSAGAFGAHSHGGARPQTAEIIKTFSEKCPSVMINNIKEKAAYIVVLDHEGGKGALRHKNKVAVFDAQSGDSIVSKSTLSLGGSVEEACRGIARHWAEHKPASPASADMPTGSAVGAKLQPAVATAPVPGAESGSPAASGARLVITSVPSGADIEIDGAFMGNAPSSLQLQPGDHKIAVKKSGYKDWERTLRVMGGEVNIKAELEKN